jgi:hypothetical protein
VTFSCLLTRSAEFINLSGNNFAGTIPTEYGELEELHSLNLAENVGITGTIPTELQALEELFTLDLSGTSIQGTVSDGFCDLVDETGLDIRIADTAVICSCCDLAEPDA